jgi:uncharacterized protein
MNGADSDDRLAITPRPSEAVAKSTAARSTVLAEMVADVLAAAKKEDFEELFRKGEAHHFGREAPVDFLVAAQWYRLAAEQGHADAQCSLGDAYRFGMGVPQDSVEAVRWYRQAAENGHTTAQQNLAEAYRVGRGVPRDFAEAIRLYRRAAENRSAETRYSHGMPAKDDHESARWYRKAAEQGCAVCQDHLGWLYILGQGVSKDESEAMKWLVKAAEQGDLGAQQSLGVFHRVGIAGSQPNYVEASKWFRKAAEQGDASAEHGLGGCYLDRESVLHDSGEAVKWFRRSAEQGNAPAQNSLGECYYDGAGVSQEYVEAVKWFRKAAEQGDANANYNLSRCFKAGNGVSKNAAEALGWLRKAAEGSCVKAQWELGLLYLSGEGLTKDLTEAEKWFRKASGYPSESYAKIQIQAWRGRSCRDGRGVSQDYNEAAKFLAHAAWMGDRDAQHDLAAIYNTVDGVQGGSKVEACKLFRLAARQGHAEAKKQLEALVTEMSPDQLAESEMPYIPFLAFAPSCYEHI